MHRLSPFFAKVSKSPSTHLLENLQVQHLPEEGLQRDGPGLDELLLVERHLLPGLEPQRLAVPADQLDEGPQEGPGHAVAQRFVSQLLLQRHYLDHNGSQ